MHICAVAPLSITQQLATPSFVTLNATFEWSSFLSPFSLFFAQQSTADKQGKVFAEWVAALPEGEMPETAAYPTLDDPFAAPNVAGIQAILEEAGVVSRAKYQEAPQRFDYHLTESGEALIPVLRSLLAWGREFAVPNDPDLHRSEARHADL